MNRCEACNQVNDQPQYRICSICSEQTKPTDSEAAKHHMDCPARWTTEMPCQCSLIVNSHYA